MRRFHYVIPVALVITMICIGYMLHHKITQNNYFYARKNASETKKLIDDKSYLKKVQLLEKFMGKYKSPLYPYARLLVTEATKNKIDFRLLTAIAMNESSLCKVIPNNSYNCWGWGIYADKITRFTSYEDAISTISRGVRKNYYDKGMASPSAIMQSYTPSSPDGAWAKKIHRWYAEIGNITN
jgi:hypothetical protein